MSRKSDIDGLYDWAQFQRLSPDALRTALEAAHMLGRAEGLTTARTYGGLQCVRIAKRLRAKVRKAGETK